jgi:hypothetical protein
MTRTVTRIVLPLTLLTATFALALPAQASLTRTFVSAAGSDANPCTITQPCASFAHAYSLTAASGIVAALDPGKISASGGSGTLKVSIDNVTVSGNSNGIVTGTPANVLLGRSVITGNATGVGNGTAPNTFYTYKDNRINLNGARHKRHCTEYDIRNAVTGAPGAIVIAAGRLRRE